MVGQLIIWSKDFNAARTQNIVCNISLCGNVRRLQKKNIYRRLCRCVTETCITTVRKQSQFFFAQEVYGMLYRDCFNGNRDHSEINWVIKIYTRRFIETYL